jgi:hypothetical protein
MQDFSILKREIFFRGVAPESGAFIWPVLFGVLPFTTDASAIDAHLSRTTAEYLRI